MLTPELEEKKRAELEQAQTFSFDVKEFQAHIAEGDFLAMIIRAHIYVEHVLIQTLSDEFRKPDAIELRRLNFPAKLDLCIALGLIHDIWRPAVNRLNEMRNKMAHRLDHIFNDDDRLKLMDLYPAQAQELCLEDYGEKSKVPWSRVFQTAVAMLDVSRQALKRRRIEMKYATINARLVIDKAEGRKPS